MKFSSINRRKVQRLIKSLEPIYSNTILNLTTFLSLKNNENPYKSYNDNYLLDAIKYLKQEDSFYRVQNKNCIKYTREPSIRVNPHGFTNTGELVDVIVLPSNTNLSNSFKGNYEKYLKYKLTILNLNSCNIYLVNVDEYSTKKELNKALELNANNNIKSGYNFKNNKYWVLNLDKKYTIKRDYDLIRNEFLHFIKLYKSQIEKPNAIKNFEVDRTNWIKASSTWEPARNDHLVAYLKYHKITNLGNTPCDPVIRKRKRCDTWDVQKLESLSQPFPETFTEYILNRGNDFENDIYNKLVQKFGSNIQKVGESYQASSKINYMKTIKLMKKGVPLLFQPVIQNPLNKTYGCPDLLIRSDYLNKLVEEQVISSSEEKIPATKLKLDYHYRIIDIKSSTLELSSDKEMILNTSTTKPYKQQLLIYNRGLDWMQGYEPTCAYILSNGWCLKKSKIRVESSDPFNRLSKIDYSQRDYDYNMKVDETLDFLQRIRTDKGLKYDPPSENLMRPNMKVDSDSKYIKIKTELANKYNDATLVHMVTTENRNYGISNGIKSYLDKDCNIDTLGITGNKKRKIIDSILKFNQKPYNAKCPVIPSKITNNIFDWKRNNKLEFYIDFETIGYAYIDDDRKRQFIFMIGVGYLEPDNRDWKFKTFYTKNQTREEELKILLDLNEFIGDLNKKHNTVGNVYHWSHAEKSEYDKARKEYPQLDNINWCDLLKLFKSEPILVHGNIHGFGLKKIAKQMKKLGLINTVWDNNSKCMHGMDAMHLGWKYYQNNNVDEEIFEEIKKYNEIDCLTMKDILLYLRNNNI